jgi:hypothetical protein
MKLPTWLRSVAGIGTGVLNAIANGTKNGQVNPWQLALSAALAAMGIISHLSSTSDANSPTGKVPVTKSPSQFQP